MFGNNNYHHISQTLPIQSSSPHSSYQYRKHICTGRLPATSSISPSPMSKSLSEFEVIDTQSPKPTWIIKLSPPRILGERHSMFKSLSYNHLPISPLNIRMKALRNRHNPIHLRPFRIIYKLTQMKPLFQQNSISPSTNSLSFHQPMYIAFPNNGIVLARRSYNIWHIAAKEHTDEVSNLRSPTANAQMAVICNEHIKPM